MKELHLDLETRSSVDINRGGVYKYASSPDFDILLLGYSIDGGDITVIDLASGESVPEEVFRAIASDDVIKWAHNASFERVALSYWLRRHRPDLFVGYGIDGDPTQDFLGPASWRCTMVLSAYNGLPLSLDKVGAVLGFEEQKLKEGRDLIRYFCTPSRTEGREWNLPEHAPDRWKTFIAYNRRDVEVEMQIHKRLRNYPVPDSVWEEYCLSEEVNDRGIRIDRQLVEQAVRIDDLTKASLMEEMRARTGLNNPNSVTQLKDYLSDNGMEVDSLGKKEVAAMMKDAPDSLAEVLSLRLQLAKSSVKKYTAMLVSACDDDRCRGMFQFYGANRTGRFAGRIVQLQNLHRNEMPDLEQARALVRRGDYDALAMLYDSVPEVLAELVRTAFIPAEGYKFVVADFSAIEARVLSYLAGEQWRMDVFHNGRDIYCESASRMFNCVVEKHGQNAHLRQKGKISELALGYGGSFSRWSPCGAAPTLASCNTGGMWTMPSKRPSSERYPRRSGASALRRGTGCCSYPYPVAGSSLMSNHRSARTDSAARASPTMALTATSTGPGLRATGRNFARTLRRRSAATYSATACARCPTAASSATSTTS